MVVTTLPRNGHNQEVPDGDTCSSLLWCKQANHFPMWCKPVWLRGWSPYSKMKFASHPSVCSECGWPYKSTTLKCNVRKVHSCTLSWRNTPSEGFSTSPVQRLMGQRTHTLLPTAEKLLQPNSNLKTTARSLAARKILQCKQYYSTSFPWRWERQSKWSYLGNRNGA